MLTVKNCCDIYFILKIERCFKLNFLFSISVLHAKEKPPINIVGDVGGRIAIVIVCVISELAEKTL